jgi:xanthosine utilization system XapX-like protein
MHIALHGPVASRRQRAAGAAAGSVAARRAAAAAAVLSLGVAWVHFAYTASHFRQWWAYGAFFLAAGAAQALFAPLVMRVPSPPVVAAGIAMNLGIVGMYVVSRTAGPPLGPHAHIPEAAGAVDLSTTAAEIVLVGVLLTMLGTTARRWVTNLLLAVGAALWVLRATGHLLP